MAARVAWKWKTFEQEFAKGFSEIKDRFLSIKEAIDEISGCFGEDTIFFTEYTLLPNRERRFDPGVYVSSNPQEVLTIRFQLTHTDGVLVYTEIRWQDFVRHRTELTQIIGGTVKNRIVPPKEGVDKEEQKSGRIKAIRDILSQMQGVELCSELWECVLVAIWEVAERNIKKTQSNVVSRKTLLGILMQANSDYFPTEQKARGVVTSCERNGYITISTRKQMIALLQKGAQYVQELYAELEAKGLVSG